MAYYMSKELNVSFEKAIDRVTEELKKEGFGILTDIDVQKILKTKLNEEFRKYRILGACNPPYAHRALQTEDKIGVLLPCNFIVQELSQGKVNIAAVNPAVSMQAVNNPKLKEIAEQIRNKLSNVMENL